MKERIKTIIEGICVFLKCLFINFMIIGWMVISYLTVISITDVTPIYKVIIKIIAFIFTVVFIFGFLYTIGDSYKSLKDDKAVSVSQYRKLENKNKKLRNTINRLKRELEVED